MRLCYITVATVFLIAQIPTIASAESSDQALAQELYEAAALLFEAENYTVALERLERSYQLFESLRTLFSIGMCHHALGRYPQAFEALERYLDEGGARVPPALRRQATEAIEQMRRDMADLTIEVNEEGAEITIDGAPVGTSPLDGPVSVGPGAHVVEATLEGFVQGRQVVTVTARVSARVRFELVAGDTGDGVAIESSVVRVVALRGARAEGRYSSQTGHLRTFVTPSIVHGTGVVVHRDGLIVTARQVVSGTDVVALFFASEQAPRLGRVVGVEGVRNVAFIVASGERFPAPLAIPQGQRAPRPGQSVTTWVHSRESASAPPRAVQGQLVRLTADGQAELSLPLGPDEVGGPVLDASGQLIGIINEAQGRGVNIMEPLARFAQATRAWTRPDVSDDPFTFGIGEQEAASAVAALAESGPTVELSTILDRWAALRNDEALSPTFSIAFALCAYTMWLDVLEQHSAAETIFLPEEIRWRVMRLADLASFFAQRARLANPILLVRYPALAVIADLGGQQVCGVEGSTCCAGTCEDGLRCQRGRCLSPPVERREREPSEPGRRAWFRLGAAGVFVFDDHDRAQGLGGGAGTLLGLAQFLPYGTLRPIRFSFLGGVELTAGAFRDVAAVSFLVDLGFRLALGSPRVAVAFSALYNLGVIWAEKRTSFAYASYRFMLGLQLRRLSFGVSYRETGRNADSTFRGLALYVDWAF